jgi:hypothetical protein
VGFVEQSKKLDLERIVFIGRTFEEYLDMFSLSEEELKEKKILDCPAGACSLNVRNRIGPFLILFLAINLQKQSPFPRF